MTFLVVESGMADAPEVAIRDVTVSGFDLTILAQLTRWTTVGTGVSVAFVTGLASRDDAGLYDPIFGYLVRDIEPQSILDRQRLD